MPTVFLLRLAAAFVLIAGGALTAASAEAAPPVQTHAQHVSETASASLAGTEWLLKSLRGEDVDPEVGASLDFDGDGNVSGNGGCNRFRGAVTTEGQTLKFGNLASTMMACDDTKTRLEADYHAAMADTVAFRIDQGELVLLNEQDEVVARLTAAKQI